LSGQSEVDMRAAACAFIGFMPFPVPGSGPAPQSICSRNRFHGAHQGATAPRHDTGKACIVVAGPTLVTLIPMAAAPPFRPYERFGPSFGGNGAARAAGHDRPSHHAVLTAPLAGVLSER
jgi:hypothetical protein